MKAFEAIIFDMDGVIVDSEPLHERAFIEVFEEMGYGASHGMHFPAYYGQSDKTLWLDFVSKHKPPQPLDELMAWKQDRFLDILRKEQPIFETLPELIEKLSKRYKLALASGSLHVVIDEVLAMKSLRHYFPIRVSAEDVAHGKPAPDVFLRAAELLGVNPTRCCVIEDSAAGVQAARSAGMQVIAITNTLPAERLAAATHIVETYEQIEKLLL
ncbi:MAG: HAD family phosphatase [Pedosphaera sp.]|nr:HAD family phosphatase [Pedosphaera sp.]